MPRVHIIGAGLAGLACAVQLGRAGREAVLYEAAGQAGGRCRSFFDETLGREIDNGNHLMLSGNGALMSYLDILGARDTLYCPPHARYPFVDLATGERWSLDISAGRIPWWIFAPSRRVPDSRAGDYVRALRLALGEGRTVAQCFDTARPAYRRFWEPLAIAVLNTAAEEASAALLWRVLVESLGQGAAASRPCIARDGLSHSLVDPALRYLAERGIDVRFGHRLRGLSLGDATIEGLDFPSGPVALEDADSVVLAVPPAAAGALVPELAVPLDSRPIVNGHFALEPSPHPPERIDIIGIVGGDAHWLFRRGSMLSVTVSAASTLVDLPAEEIAPRLWSDICRALDLGSMGLPPHRIVKEKRATFAQTPAAARRRPAVRTGFRNLFLAGDWTDTGLPATIEGAIRSGQRAARELGAR